MGKIRNKNIKKLAKTLLEKYPDLFSVDFESNKKALLKFRNLIQSKKVRNQVAGYIVRLIKLKTRKEQESVAA